MLSPLKFYHTPKSKSGYRWFVTLVIIAISLTLVYFGIHICFKNDYANKKIDFLTKSQVILVNEIINTPPDEFQLLAMRSALSAVDTAISDEWLQNEALKDCLLRQIKIWYPNITDDCMNDLREQLKQMSLGHVKLMLPVYPISQQSFFWLSTNRVYLELVFWCLFGVICNLLYHTSEYLRTKDFVAKEIYAQLAKLVYSPFCVVIIYICYDALSLGGEYSVMRFSFYSIAVAFLLGFFSGRMIDLLDRIKNLLLPGGSDIKTNEATGTNIDAEPATPEIIQEAIEAKGEEWVNSYPNVTGLSVNHKVAEGSSTKEFSLVFKVSKKEENISSGKIPEQIIYKAADGKTYAIETDVVQEDTPIAQSSVIDAPPYALGCRIAREARKEFGTAGLLLEHGQVTGKKFLLSCYHVLCSKELASNNKTYTGSTDHGVECVSSNGNKHKIGRVWSGKLSATTDFAVAELGTEIDFSEKVHHNHRLKGFRTVAATDKGMEVFMCGSSSGEKSGTIKSYYCCHTISYGGNEVSEKILGLIEIDPISKHGDSGAAIYDKDGKIIGILVAGSTTSSYVLPVHTYLSENNYNLIT